MNTIVNLIAKYQKNTVVSLKDLRLFNIYLFKLYQNNADKITDELFTRHGVSILNDLILPKDFEKMRLYILYHYGNGTFNITEFRKKEPYVASLIYNNIGSLSGFIRALGMRCAFIYKGNTYYVGEKPPPKERKRIPRKKSKMLTLLDERVDSEGFVEIPSERYFYTSLTRIACYYKMDLYTYLQSCGYKFREDKKNGVRKRAKSSEIKEILDSRVDSEGFLPKPSRKENLSLYQRITRRAYHYKLNVNGYLHKLGYKIRGIDDIR
jgi:hypothetical protein